jgi:hypothetical protein
MKIKIYENIMRPKRKIKNIYTHMCIYTQNFVQTKIFIYYSKPFEAVINVQ